MKSSPGPVVFFPRNPIAAAFAVAVAMLVLKTPKKVQSEILAIIRALRA
jgi:hypothetical protein